MLNNKRAEIGESITWVVATVIILVVLTIFIFASNVLGKFQTISVSSGEKTLNSDNYLEIKTQKAFSINGNNKEIINKWIGYKEIKEEELSLEQELLDQGWR